MLLRKCAERILDFVDLEDGELNFLGSVGPHIERSSGDLLLWDIVVDRILDDISDAEVDLAYHRRVCASKKCRLKTGGESHGTHCATAPRVETLGVEIPNDPCKSLFELKRWR